jgi:hypothetical protein
MVNFKYDVAISLCNEDLEFAKRLVKAINPSLNVFFYSDRQHALISKSGPEAFSKVFKIESRIVVVLSRDLWSKSFYTEIERNAIVDRTKDGGYQFLMIMPMKSGEIPPWYPSTQIYASPERFSVDELAHFIEFKVADEGGQIKPITLEDQYQNLLDRIAEKKVIINLQHNKDAVEFARNEMTAFKKCFDEKSDFLGKSIFDRTSYFPFSGIRDSAYFAIGNYLLEAETSFSHEFIPIGFVNTQEFVVGFKLFKILKDKTKELVDNEARAFYYTPELQGWAIRHIFEQASNSELNILFHNRDKTEYYDLIDIERTSSLVDRWFQKLLTHSSEKIERYL